MKFFLIALGVALAVWWWMRKQNPSGPAAMPHKTSAPRAPTPTPLPMAQCAVCGLHLPRAEALPGPQGRTYCSAAHRQSAGS